MSNTITLTKDELYNLLKKAQLEHHKHEEQEIDKLAEQEFNKQPDWIKKYSDWKNAPEWLKTTIKQEYIVYTDDWAMWYAEYIYLTSQQSEARNKLHQDFKDFYGDPDQYYTIKGDKNV